MIGFEKFLEFLGKSEHQPHPWHSLIKLNCYESEHEMFLSSESYFQVFELDPRVGLDNSSITLITDMLEQHLKASMTMQLTLISKVNVNKELIDYAQQQGPCHLRQERAKFFLDSMRNSEGSRGFCQWHLFLTLSAPEQQVLSFSSSAIRSCLDACLFNPRILGPQQLIEAYYMLWSLIDSNLESGCYNPYELIGAQLADSQITCKSHQDTLAWNDTISSQTLYVKSPPQEFNAQKSFVYLGDGLRESFTVTRPFVLSWFCHCPDQEKLASNYLVSEVRWRRQSESMLAQFIDDIENTIDEFSQTRHLLNSGSTLVRQGLSMTIFAAKDELEEQVCRLKQYFSTLDFKLSVSKRFHFNLFLQHLPAIFDREWADKFYDFSLIHTLPARQAAQFMPLQAEWRGSRNFHALLVNRCGGLCSFDPFDKGDDKGNFNVCVTGKSGSGKSNLMAYLVLERLQSGGQCFVIDVGYSYQRLGHKLGARVIDFREGRSLCLNPFCGLEKMTPQSMTFLKMLVSKMCFQKRLTCEIEDTTIEKAISHSFSQFGAKATLFDVHNSLLQEDSVESCRLAKALFPFSHGVYKEYFHGDRARDFHQDFIIFELEDLKDKPQLQEIVMLTIIFRVQINMYTQRHRKKYLVVDEAWQLLGQQGTSISAQFLENIARRIRKFNGSLIVGTQGIDDFFTNSCGQAIFHNSDWLICLSQKEDALKRAIKQCPQLEPCLQALESLKTKAGQYSEALIRSPMGHALLRLYLNKELLELFSTEATDMLEGVDEC